MFNVPDAAVLSSLTVPQRRGRHARRAGRAAVDHAVVMDDPHDLRGAFRAAARARHRAISCIGGRTIARAADRRGAVQDLYLTTSPQIGGEPNTPLYSKPLQARTSCASTAPARMRAWSSSICARQSSD